MVTRNNLCFLLVVLCATLALTVPAGAAFDLQITEMWPGQSGPDLTADWFEITNRGDMAWTSGVDGDLYYDDSSNSIIEAELIAGISSIDPGQSVVVVITIDDAIINGVEDRDDFLAVWDPVKGPITAGYLDLADDNTPGLGGGGDTVNLFIDNGGLMNIASASYPDTGNNDAQSWDSVLNTFSVVGNASGAVATLALGGDNMDVPAIGSPGMAAVPEPSSLLLIVFGACFVVARRR